MIKQITSALKITPFVFIVAIVFLFGLSYTYAAFMDNTSTPPNNNAPAPLNIGSKFQNKTGNLGANGLVTKVLSVNGAIDFNGVTRTSWPNKPPVCTGTNKALQFNGTNYSCVKISANSTTVVSGGGYIPPTYHTCYSNGGPSYLSLNPCYPIGD